MVLVLFDSSSEGSSLIPVPILFDNYRDESGNEVNRGSVQLSLTSFMVPFPYCGIPILMQVVTVSGSL